MLQVQLLYKPQHGRMAVCDVLGFNLMQFFSCMADEHLQEGHSDGQKIRRKEGRRTERRMEYQIKRAEGRPDTCKNSLEKE